MVHVEEHFQQYGVNKKDNMSSTIEADIKKKILGRSKAEKVFRPWWDTLEDYLLNTLVIFGFLTLPTAYVTGNPVECVLHPDIWNKSKIFDPMRVKQIDFYDDNDEYNEENSGYPINTVRITHWYVKRYCTEKYVSKFVFYFPYILLIVPLTLVLVDRIFIKTFAAGNKIKQFYDLLVEESLRREDVDSLSRDNIKNLHEIMQSFRFSNVCYWSYLSRTCLEIVLSIGLFLIYWCWGIPNLLPEIECDVHGLAHSCVLPNHQFYFYILAASTALLCIYILCNTYNLIWIICPQLGTMYRVIKSYQDCLGGVHPSDPGGIDLIGSKKKRNAVNHSHGPYSNKYRKVSNITTDNFLNVYFDRRHKDLKLLLNLLAETSGLPESFRILTLFDKKFQSLWKPQNLRIEEYETVISNGEKTLNINIKWNDAPIGHFLTNYDSSLSFEYTVDISPSPLNELGLKSILYKRDEDSIINGEIAKGSSSQSLSLLESQGDIHGSNTKHRYEVNFENIIHGDEDGEELDRTGGGRVSDGSIFVTLTISTELNGRTVTQMVEKFTIGNGGNSNSSNRLVETNARRQRASFCSMHSLSKNRNSSSRSTAPPMNNNVVSGPTSSSISSKDTHI
ncbi:uncharacterized protein [Lepeophtheirus salmonis]|uniref:uncharacterized protein isoform X2 n=1 Tax=Lepeophtheirus salmonis TaxID=72036 RepID=UPI003AF3DCC6